MGERTRRSIVVVLGVMFAALITLVLPSTATAVFDSCDTGSTPEGVGSVTPWRAPWTPSEVVVDRIGSGKYGATAYEWFGSAALDFTSVTQFDSAEVNGSIEQTCAGPEGLINRGTANAVSGVWAAASGLNDFGLNVYQFVSDMRVFRALVDKVSLPLLLGFNNGDTEAGGLISMYGSGVLIAMLITGVMVAVRLLRRRSKEAITGTAWSLGAMFAGLLILGNMSAVVGGVSTTFQEITEVANTAGTGLARSVISGSQDTEAWCLLSDDIPNRPPLTADGIPTGTRKSVRENACRMWVMTYLEPWAGGQFGTANPTANLTDDNNPLFVIPGLATGPAAGDLIAWHLSSTRVNPREQKYLDGATDKGAASAAIRAGEDVDYPVGAVGNACPADGDCPVNTGHDPLWVGLTNTAAGTEVDDMQALTWAGTGNPQIAARWNAVLNMTMGSVFIIGVSLFFGAVLGWYQLILALMIGFLPIPLIAMVIPGFGQKVARDYLSRLIQLLLMTAMAVVFMSLTVVMMLYLPSLLLGSGAAAVSPALSFTVSGVIGGAMIFLWFRVRKFLGARAFVPGADAKGTVLDPTRHVSGGLAAAGKTAGAVAAVAGAAAVTAGVGAAGAVTAMNAKNALAKNPAATRGGAAPADGVTSAAASAITPSEVDAPPTRPAVGAGSAAAATPTPRTPNVASSLPSGAEPGPLSGQSSYLPTSQPFSTPAERAATQEAARQQLMGAPAQVQETAAPAYPKASFRKEFSRRFGARMSNFGGNVTSNILAGGGVAGVMRMSKATLNEVVSGRQVKNIVTDAHGNQVILESGMDDSEGRRGYPVTPGMGGGYGTGVPAGAPTLSATDVANATYAAMMLAQQHFAHNQQVTGIYADSAASSPDTTTQDPTTTSSPDTTPEADPEREWTVTPSGLHVAPPPVRRRSIGS